MASPAWLLRVATGLGRRAGQLLFALWILGVVGVLAGLARTACEAPKTSAEVAAVFARAVAGWRVQHSLPVGHEITPTLAALLMRRGPRAGVDEEISFEGDEGDPGWAAKFSRAGWRTVPGNAGPSPSSEPQLRIFSPQGVLVWRGEYRAAELKAEGAVVLDDVVLLRLVRGENGPDHVPVGCSVPLEKREGILAKWLSENFR